MMASQRLAELTSLMDLLDAHLKTDLPIELLEGLDDRVNKLAVKLGEDPSRWTAALQLAQEIISCMMAGERSEDPLNLLIALYLARFLSHPMCRPVIAMIDDEENG